MKRIRKVVLIKTLKNAIIKNSEVEK